MTTNNLQLGLEGRITVTTGELMVIDPGYLVTLDLSDLYKLETVRQRRWTGLLAEEAEEAINLTKGREERSEGLKQKREKLKNEPSLLPPYIATQNNHIVFRIGDKGNYPVIKTNKRIHIIFDGVYTRGDILGDSLVNSGMQTIVEPSKVIIERDVDYHCYVKWETPNGSYSCRFIRKNGALSLRRIK